MLYAVCSSMLNMTVDLLYILLNCSVLLLTRLRKELQPGTFQGAFLFGTLSKTRCCSCKRHTHSQLQHLWHLPQLQHQPPQLRQTPSCSLLLLSKILIQTQTQILTAQTVMMHLHHAKQTQQPHQQPQMPQLLSKACMPTKASRCKPGQSDQRKSLCQPDLPECRILYSKCL